LEAPKNRAVSLASFAVIREDSLLIPEWGKNAEDKESDAARRKN
jgi:hypothetical protein